jgi:hypothetical protein
VTELIYTTAVAASIPSLALELDVKECEITLDSTRAPYVEATIKIPIPVEAVMETIDPRDAVDPDDLRVLIEAEVEWISPADPPQNRTFDLVLHGRTIDHAADRVILVCHSDEALLIDGAPVSASIDRTYRQEPTVTLRDDLIPDVLALAGLSASLEAGAADADVEGYRELVNLCINPSGENATPSTGLALRTNSSSLTRSTAVTPVIGTYSVRWTVVAAGGSTIRMAPDNVGGYFTCKPGHTYAFVVALRSSVARDAFVWLRFHRGNGTGEVFDVVGTTIATSTSGWIAYEVTAVAPDWATAMEPVIATQGNSAGQFHYVDVMRLVEFAPDEVIVAEYSYVRVLQNFFDGSSNPFPSLYTVAWDGATNASTSRMIPIYDRDPAALDIVPGVTWWDYLSQHVRAANYRLWSDENRDWWLTEPLETVAGTVTIAEGDNAIDGDDVISFQATSDEGTPLYFTGVVVRYHWTDVEGVTHERFDVAGTSRKVHRVGIAGAWPGAGRAAAILAQAEGRGRTQELVAVMNLDATPGMALSTDLPSTPEQIGVVSAVTWRWSDGPDHGTMTVRARDLEEA